MRRSHRCTVARDSNHPNITTQAQISPILRTTSNKSLEICCLLLFISQSKLSAYVHSFLLVEITQILCPQPLNVFKFFRCLSEIYMLANLVPYLSTTRRVEMWRECSDQRIFPFIKMTTSELLSNGMSLDQNVVGSTNVGALPLLSKIGKVLFAISTSSNCSLFAMFTIYLFKLFFVCTVYLFKLSFFQSLVCPRGKRSSWWSWQESSPSWWKKGR